MGKKGKIIKCANCGREVYKYPCHIKSPHQNFCSSRCWNKIQIKNAINRKIAISCAHCRKEFYATKDHSRWPKFCSRDCFNKDNAKNVLNFQCAFCGKAGIFYKSDIKYTHHFCSNECSRRGRLIESNLYQSHTGIVHKNDGCVFVATTKKLHGQRVYRAQHRAVVEKYIGRKLSHNGEPIIHLNGLPSDNRPSNLFVCRDRAELKRILVGTLDFPTKSNLEYLRCNL